MRKAIIDLGTNTFNLLVAEVNNGDLNILHSEKRAVMLGMGGINEGIISDDAFDRGLVAINEFSEKAREFEVDTIVGIGTSALREAVNSRQFINEAERRSGIRIKIVHGLKEAKLIYTGVKECCEDLHDAIIMDIGGGSTELISCDSHDVIDMKSYNIGVSRMFQLLDAPKDFWPSDLEKIREFLKDETADTIHELKGSRLIGSSGTFETFYEMIHERDYISNGKAVQFDIDRLKAVIDWSINANWEQRKNHPHIVLMRRRMLPLAALKVKWIMDHLDIKEVWLSPYSLKEGTLLTNFEEI